MASKHLDFSNFRDSLKFLIPIVITIALAAFFTITVKITFFPGNTTPDQNITPIPQPSNPGSDPLGTAISATANALFYVFIILIGGFLLVYLIRSGRIRIIEVLFASMMGISIFLFSDFVFQAVLYQIFNLIFTQFPYLATSTNINIVNILLNDGMLYFTFILGAITFLTLAFEKFRSQNAHNIIMILFGSLMGTVFGVFFPVETLFFVLLALALYDIYAVFFGPIKKMFESKEFSNKNTNFPYDTTNENNFSTKTGTTAVDDPLKKETIYLNPNTRNRTTPPTEQKDAFALNNTSTNNSGTTTVPARRSMRIEPAQVSLPVYMTPDINIGLGDFVFFSVLIAKAFYEGLRTLYVW